MASNNKSLIFLNLQVDEIWTRDVYTVSADISDQQAADVAKALANPVLQQGVVGETLPEGNCAFLVSVGFKPGVTDNVGRSAKEAVSDIIGRTLRDGRKDFQFY